MERKPQRLFVETALAEGADITCGREQANYLLNVLRLGPGDDVLVFDGHTGEWRARLKSGRRGACSLEIVAQTRPQELGPDIHYLFAPLKRARLDYMVQKATEMGVAHLAPVITRRTQTARVNLKRMRANAVEAAEQCGILWVPDVAEPRQLSAVLDQWDEDRQIIYCDEVAPIADPLQGLRDLSPGPLALLIGPEGGFDESEREMLQAKPSVTAISLGPRVMRADTAAVAALALINAALGDWR